MKKGFYTIMSAQFFSSLADNALLVAAIELLKTGGAPSWHIPALTPMFALFYVLLAPLVGAFADAVPKGKVMFVSNAIKVIGCLLMLFGTNPLLAYGVVGLGAAAYSPAKYGILTELLPNSQLVKANGWIEGLTILSIILGVVLGGQLLGHVVSRQLLSFDFPLIDTGISTAPEAAIAVIVALYIVAALFNLRIPRTDAPLQPLASSVSVLIRDFSNCNARLWSDKLGQISLATTTLFWGVSSNMRVIVFAWAAAALGYTTKDAVVARRRGRHRHRRRRGDGVDARAARPGDAGHSARHRHGPAADRPQRHHQRVAGGAVPDPARRDRRLSGRADERAAATSRCQPDGLGPLDRRAELNEQACILGLGAFYTGMTRFGLAAFTSITVFGVLVVGMMWLIRRWHANNIVRYPAEIAHLLSIARLDKH